MNWSAVLEFGAKKYTLGFTSPPEESQNLDNFCHSLLYTLTRYHSIKNNELHNTRCYLEFVRCKSRGEVYLEKIDVGSDAVERTAMVSFHHRVLFICKVHQEHILKIQEGSSAVILPAAAISRLEPAPRTGSSFSFRSERKLTQFSLREYDLFRILANVTALSFAGAAMGA
ncbi:hypothetical protein EK904_000828 [Melospiza melodia maxima]|nr:hypothetical protein EK904_000828 [Melospiza melodia maxima]